MCQGWDIAALVTVDITGDDSPMFQMTGTHWVEQQAAMAGVPWVNVPTSGDTNHDMMDLGQALGRLHLDGFVSGALRSDYQKSRLERLGQRLGLRSWTPLWHHDGLQHLQDLVDHGFQVMVTSVSCEGLDEGWLGTVLDEASLRCLAELAERYRFNVEGEGGEYETLVIAGPHLPGRLEVAFDIEWNGHRGELRFH